MQNSKTSNSNERLVGLISDEFIHWGTDRFAYIREINDKSGMTFALTSADGTELGIFEERDVALAFASQYDLQAQALN